MPSYTSISSERVMNLPRPPKKYKKPIPKNTIRISKRKIQKDNKLFNHVLSVVDKKIQDRRRRFLQRRI